MRDSLGGTGKGEKCPFARRRSDFELAMHALQHEEVPHLPSVLILVLDRAPGFALIEFELKKCGFMAQCRRVETKADYLTQLEASPDIILAGDLLPGVDALHALDLLQARGLEIPFIVLASSANEDLELECMRRGAADYLLKDRMMRLGPAVRRAFQEANLGRKRQSVERELHAKNLELENQCCNPPCQHR